MDPKKVEKKEEALNKNPFSKPWTVYAVFGENDESYPIETLESRYKTYSEAMNDNSIPIHDVVGYYMSWKAYKEFLFETGFTKEQLSLN